MTKKAIHFVDRQALRHKHSFWYLTVIMLMIACGTLGLTAQDTLHTIRPITSSYAIEFGASHIADTYLTPLHYRGLHGALTYERIQAMSFDPQSYTMQLKLAAIIDHTKNPAKNATMYNGVVEASWAMMRRWKLTPSITVGLGAGPSVNIGALYHSRNGNNPVSVKFAATADITAYASWNGRLWRIPLTVRYQTSMPLVGTFFSPDYGQLYYQLYLEDDLVPLHFAWPGNYFSWDNLITADLHFGCTSLRIGYHGRMFSSKFSDIVSQNFTHAIVLGISTEWISLRPNSRDIQARIISAY